jgi:poly(3-hydroxybutyrate) depolymerase
MRALICTILLAFAALPIAARADEAATKQIAARVELHAISSLTLSDQQFLAGDANGKAVTVAGEFRIAQGSGKLPVVILLHGSRRHGAERGKLGA